MRTMIIRPALPDDIPRMQIVRHSVRENVLSDPSRVTDADCLDFITRRGRGWVAEVDGLVVGFSVADLVEDNVWALFVHMDHEGRGVGKELHRVMLDWYFGQGKDKIWLGTEPGTRAEAFYRRAGWRATGLRTNGELRFEMEREDWLRENR